MDTISIDLFQKDLANLLDKVSQDHTPLLVTREEGKPAIVMSLEDFNAYEATAHLMASPRNAARLSESIAEIEAGKATTRALLDE